MTWPRVLDAVLDKAMDSALDHLDCRDRVKQAMIDVYLILTEPKIREQWEAEE